MANSYVMEGICNECAWNHKGKCKCIESTKYGKPANQKRCKYYTLSIGYTCLDCKHALLNPPKCACEKSERFGKLITTPDVCKNFQINQKKGENIKKPKNICRAKRCVWLNKCGSKIGTCFWGKCVMGASK